ncbi:MAG: DUF4864 domain-containing protein [Gammaproteobacteria bacterium]|nr:DUF4864 domain-containing protein [Gammaproteobacteria bacterium]
MTSACLLAADIDAVTAADAAPTLEPSLKMAVPTPELDPGEVVRIQLEALRANDAGDEGIAVAFRFASPQNKASTGPLPRFIHMIKAGPYRLMLEYERASYSPTRIEGNRAVQRVTLVGARQIRSYDFLLRRQTGPPCDGCWMTEAVLVVPGTEQPV